MKPRQQSSRNETAIVPAEPVSGGSRESPLSMPEHDPDQTLRKLRALDWGALFELAIGLLLILAVTLAALPAIYVAASHPLGVPLVAGGMAVAVMAGVLLGTPRD